MDRLEATSELTINADRALVWAMVCDTNRWDRAGGLTPATYHWERRDSQRVRVAHGQAFGIDLEWIEPPYRWVEASFVEGRREFVGGPVAEGGFSVRLSGEDGAVRCIATSWARPRNMLGRAVAMAVVARFKVVLPRYLKSIATYLRNAAKTSRELPASVRARELMSGRYDIMLSGARSPVNETELNQRVQRLRRQPIQEELADRLARMLREASDDELEQLRPFELADRWGAPRREVLRTLLYASISGVTSLNWQVLCPNCRVGAQRHSSLKELTASSHCEACAIDFGAGFDSYIEAVFTPHPSVREVSMKTYCASSPAFRPHVFAQLPVAAIDEEADELRSAVRVRLVTDEGQSHVDLDASDGLSIQVDGDSLDVRPLGSKRIVVSGSSSPGAFVSIESLGWKAPIATGSVVATLPEFRELFDTEAPANGIELSVSEVALLFTDLKGSTAMYEEVGDASAYASVSKHFEALSKVVDDAEGAVVKTMGDAIMAVFASPAQAMQAAADMIAAHDALGLDERLGVKVGVHAGPCLVVTANGKLDYFGTTVNVTARLQGKAESGEVVVSKALLDRTGVSDIVKGWKKKTFKAELRGIAEKQTLLRFTPDV